MGVINRVGMGVVISGVFFVSSCATTKQVEYFSVRNVSVDRAGCFTVDSRQLQFACHRLIPGGMIALGSRDFYPSRKIDGGYFSKATIILPNEVRSGDIFELPSDVASLFYSYGPSAFAGKRGCYGFAVSGKIEILSINRGSMEVSVDGVIDMKSPLDWPGQCGAERLRKEWRASWAEYDSLGAWEGRLDIDDTPFDEAHPRGN